MKNIFFRFAILCSMLACIPEKVTAQIARVGIKGGVSIPNLKPGDDDNPVSSGYNSKPAADFAIYGEFPFSPSLALQVQLEYSGQGGKKNGLQAFPTPEEYTQMYPPGQAPSYLYASYKSETKLNYLMIPILIKTKFSLGPSADIYSNFGPFVSFLVSAKNITSGSGHIYADKEQSQQLTTNSQSFDNNEDIRNDLKKINAGIEAGAGLSFNFGKSQIFIEGGVNYGLFKIQKDKTHGQNTTGAATISIGYSIILGQ